MLPSGRPFKQLPSKEASQLGIDWLSWLLCKRNRFSVKASVGLPGSTLRTAHWGRFYGTTCCLTRHWALEVVDLRKTVRDSQVTDRSSAENNPCRQDRIWNIPLTTCRKWLWKIKIFHHQRREKRKLLFVIAVSILIYFSCHISTINVSFNLILYTICSFFTQLSL